MGVIDEVLIQANEEGKNNATIFPKSQMQDKTTDVIEMISTHMPPTKVKIRS